MYNFVRFQYHPDMAEDPEFATEVNKIWPIENFDPKTISLPAHAIGFTPFEAATPEDAEEIYLNDLPAYYLCMPAEIMTTDELREKGKTALLMNKMMFGMVDKSKLSKEEAVAAAFINMHHFFTNNPSADIENMAEGTFPDQENPAVEMIAALHEYDDCYRVMGTWPMDIFGIKNRDTVLHKVTREVISAPIDPSTVKPRPDHPFPLPPGFFPGL